MELGIYNGIPHLLIPVVTDEEGGGCPQWAVTEDDEALPDVLEVGVRDLASYNAKAARTEG